jgi:hypothetical protein
MPRTIQWAGPFAAEYEAPEEKPRRPVEKAA